MFSRRNSGFTIIELVILISIIALLTGVAVPKIKRVAQRQALASYARQFAGDLRYARQLGLIRTSEDPLNIIKWGNNKYMICKNTNVIEEKYAPEGVVFTNNIFDEVYFSVLGAPSNSCTIKLNNSYGDQYNVVILLHTGRIRYEHDAENW